MIYSRDRLNEFHGILQNPWKSMIYYCFSLIFIDFSLFFIDFHCFRWHLGSRWYWTKPKTKEKPENLIQTFRNTSETFVSEGENSLQQSGMIYRRDRLNEFHEILQNTWKSLKISDFRWISLFRGQKPMLRHLYVKISFWIFDENQKFQNFLKVFQIYFLESLGTLLRGVSDDMFSLREVSSKGVHT